MLLILLIVRQAGELFRIPNHDPDGAEKSAPEMWKFRVEK